MPAACSGEPARRRHAGFARPRRPAPPSPAHPQRADQHQGGAVGVEELGTGAGADGHGQLRAGQDAVVHVHAQAAHAAAVGRLQHHLPAGQHFQRLGGGTAVDHLALRVHDPDAQLAFVRPHLVEGGGPGHCRPRALFCISIEVVDRLQLAADLGDFLAFHFALERRDSVAATPSWTPAARWRPAARSAAPAWSARARALIRGGQVRRDASPARSPCRARYAAVWCRRGRPACRAAAARRRR